MTMTRRQRRYDLENYKYEVEDRLQGRDIERAVHELIAAAENVIMDEVGMPLDWDSQNEDHQMAVLDIVAEKLIEIYFTTRAPKPTIKDI